MEKNSRSTGLEAESRVAEALAKNGYDIIGRNYHSRYGELDIIAELGGMIVFVEVKYRRSAEFGTPAQAVTRKKQIKIIKTAEKFLYENGLLEAPVRFDVAEVYAGGRMEIIEGAFDLNVLTEVYN